MMASPSSQKARAPFQQALDPALDFFSPSFDPLRALLSADITPRVLNLVPPPPERKSPLAEGIFAHHVHAHGLVDRFVIDSAGCWAADGASPHPHSVEVAARHGITRTGVERRIKALAARAVAVVGIEGINEDGAAFVRRLRDRREAVLAALQALRVESASAPVLPREVRILSEDEVASGARRVLARSPQPLEDLALYYLLFATGALASTGMPMMALPLSSALMKSVRRFWALPSSVLLSATGLVSPKPTGTNRLQSMPLPTRYFATARERAPDSSRFFLASPTLSVWPSTRSLVIWVLASRYALTMSRTG